MGGGGGVTKLYRHMADQRPLKIALRNEFQSTNRTKTRVQRALSSEQPSVLLIVVCGTHNIRGMLP